MTTPAFAFADEKTKQRKWIAIKKQQIDEIHHFSLLFYSLCCNEMDELLIRLLL